MITKNPMQLKAYIKKKAAEKHISAQLVMQNYMLERLLERISLSPYKHNFIIKGGFLVSAIVGLDTRATMDLDTTIKGFTLTHEAILSIFKDVCAVQIDDDVQFEVVGVADIRETDDYPGIRVSLKANYPPISVPLTVDVTTGDMITPREIEYTFSMLFDDRTISVLAYNLETVLAEKLETVLSRNIANTRPRDYYDIYAVTPVPAVPAITVQDCRPVIKSRASRPNTATIRMVFQFRAANSATRSPPSAASFVTRKPFSAVAAAPCAAACPACRAALAYCCLIRRFCHIREMGLLATCAICGLSRKDFW